MNITARLLALAATVAMLAGTAFAVAGTASAQEPTPAPSPQGPAAVQGFLQRLADNLHVTLDQLKQAVADTELQIVDELESSGKLDAGQAQKLRDRINSGKFSLGRFLVRRHDRRQERLERLRAGIVRSAASAIGVAPRDLVQELRAGKSIADVAAEHNISVDAVKSQITDDAKAKLDQAVTAGKIDQTRADEMLQKLTDRLDDILNKKKG